MPAEVCGWICEALACVNSEGVSRAPPHSLPLSPFESTDRMSMTAHLADLLPNVSAPLQGWRTEKRDLSQDRGTRGAGKGANGETKQGESEGICWGGE